MFLIQVVPFFFTAFFPRARQKGCVMKASTSLFTAAETQYDTPTLLRLKCLVGDLAAYDGEIPVDVKEIAEKLGVGRLAAKRAIAEAVTQNVLFYRNDKLYANPEKYIDFKSVDYSKADKNKDYYLKHYKFLSSDAFKRVSVRAQRFVLDVLCQMHRGLKVYTCTLRNMILNNSDYERTTGLFNIRSIGEMKKVIEEASAFLDLKIVKSLKHISTKSEPMVQVYGIRPEMLELGVHESEGNVLWICNALQKHSYHVGAITKPRLEALAKVMEYYYRQLGYELASHIISHTLVLLKNDTTFGNLLYVDIHQAYGQMALDGNLSHIVPEGVEQATWIGASEDTTTLNSLSAYFRKTAEGIAEREVAEFLTETYEEYTNRIEYETEKQSEKTSIESNKTSYSLLDAFTELRKIQLQKLRKIETLWLDRCVTGHTFKDEIVQNDRFFSSATRYMRELGGYLMSHFKQVMP